MMYNYNLIMCVFFSLSLLVVKKIKTREFIQEYYVVIRETLIRIEQNINTKDEKNKKSVVMLERLNNSKLLKRLQLMRQKL